MNSLPWVVAVAFLLAGCGGAPHSPGLEAQSQSRPEWLVELHSSCEGGAAESCLAAYAYSIGADGLYRVGPGPQGQLLTGRLSPQEFGVAETLVAQALSAARARGPRACEPPQEGGTSDRIDWVSPSGQRVELVGFDGGQTCFDSLSPELGRSLRELMRESAARHYPLPFPDDGCDGTTASLESLYGLVRGCAHDSDCAYFDGSLQPVPSDTFTFVLTGDCSGARPLVVGNLRTVLGRRSSLLAAVEIARAACRTRALAACDGFSELQPTRPAPVCAAGFCRAP